MRLDGDGPYHTIGEVAAAVGVGTHVLRYWEGKFPMLRPVQRAGGRRYYRQADLALARRIRMLLHDEGRTVAGARQLLEREARGEGATPPGPEPMAAIADVAVSRPVDADERAVLLEALRAVRTALMRLREGG